MNPIDRSAPKAAASLFTLVLSLALASPGKTDAEAPRPSRGSLPLGQGSSLAKPPEAARALSDAFVQVVKSVQPSVVSIYTMRTVASQDMGAFPFPFLFGPQGGDPSNPQQPAPRQKQEGGGSGFVIHESGYVMTNAHVVKDQEEIQVELEDRTRFPAKVIGVDEKTDVAVLKIDPAKRKLVPVAFGNSDDLQIGEWVLAIGNPFQFRNTVTAGIVSATGRNTAMRDEYAEHIQTDAAVNPGNSGGPLVNLQGQVIGINSSIWTRSGGYQGISFAIPIQLANRVAADLIHEGKVVRGWLGLQIADVDPDLADALGIPGRNGARVERVQPQSPAEKAGFKAGDVVLTIDNTIVTGSSGLRNQVAAKRPGTKVRVKLLRDGKESELQVVLGALPGDATDTVAVHPDSVVSNPDGTFMAQKFGLRLKDLDAPSRSALGLEAGVDGVLIAGIEPGSVATDKGIKPGTAVLQWIVDRSPRTPKSAKDLAQALDKLSPGSTVALKLATKDRVWLEGLRAGEAKKPGGR